MLPFSILLSLALDANLGFLHTELGLAHGHHELGVRRVGHGVVRVHAAGFQHDLPRAQEHALFVGQAYR